MVELGLDRLLDDRLNLLRGRRVGLLAHPASVDRRLRHATSLLWRHPDVDLRAVFGPQHGARGETQDNMIEWEDYRDPRTGLPVFSLYGTARKPTPEMLAEIDVLVVDLQDVGARYYTFIYTLALAMEACRDSGREVVVLDRPNPIGGTALEGPVLNPAFASFVGMYPLPIRHGMTVGELAGFFNREMGIGCDLTVVEMRGWRREMYYDRTGQQWVPPSPNIPRLETAIVYPGLCLLEGTNLSEGRGTTHPFEMSGAPWVDPDQIVEQLETLDLPGVRFRPTHFQPTYHKWTGILVGGVHLHVEDRTAFRPFLTGVALVAAYRSPGGREFEWKAPPYEYEYTLLPFDILCGTDRIRVDIVEGRDLREMEADWTEPLALFARRRKEYLLYD